MSQINYLDLPPELWRPFVLNQAVMRCGVGHLIYQQESYATCFYYLKSGKVKCFIQSEEGHERVLHLYHQGSIFGEAGFFDELPRVSSAMALEPCEIVPIDKKMVEQEFAKDPKLALVMLKYLARTVRLLSDQVDDMAFRPAPQRVARYLLTHATGNGIITATQDDIASTISASRVTVSRVLKKFMEEGWLETNYGTIVIKNQVKIEDFLDT